jgi:hypothetical protein
MPNDMTSFGMARPRWSQIVSDQILQRRLVQHLLSQQLLQSTVFVLQRPQPLGVCGLKSTEPRLRFEERRPADSMPTA